MSDCKTPLYESESFVLSAMALVGGGLSALLLFMIKSRCTNIRCCCISCDRQPLSPRNINNISIN